MKVTPRWVSVALLIGAIIAVGWAVFDYSFFNEPSADGRSRLVLGAWAGWSIGAAIFCVIGAFGIIRQAGWARNVAWTASVYMTSTLVGAIPGIAAFMGLWSSRGATKP
jgi:hypothetical protein